MTDTFQQPNREWWAQRWIEVLESFGWIRRLARARVYAREGNVKSIEFKGHKAIARVQGTAPEPYKVTLSLDPFTDEQWGYVIESMSQQALFSAKLLSGEMPASIEKVFTENGLSLFPFTKFDIHSRCSCPDPANPCKHIGAVYYLLGDRFSEDPFVLFQLRGRTKEQILEALRYSRSQSVTPDATAVPGSKAGEEPGNPGDAENSCSPAPQFSLAPAALSRFWHYTEQLEPSLVVVAPPPSSETVLDVLGAIPLKAEISEEGAIVQNSSQATMDYLKSIYQTVSQRAILAGMKVEESAS
ncbi:MAG: SWIM zinc finger family protein [Leptolyngbyaceae cyanobacterium bins.349]|nr:SWIM zinc finger family protein [Leptolyngbyaceae cyanobacterium bins.349]